MERCGGRTLHPDSVDLLRPFGPRDDESIRINRLGMLLGCLLTGHRNGWFSSLIAPPVRKFVTGPAARGA